MVSVLFFLVVVEPIPLLYMTAMGEECQKWRVGKAVEVLGAALWRVLEEVLW